MCFEYWADAKRSLLEVSILKTYLYLELFYFLY